MSTLKLLVSLIVNRAEQKIRGQIIDKTMVKPGVRLETRKLKRDT